MTYTITSWKTTKCTTKKGSWNCLNEKEAQEMISKLHQAGHEYLSMKPVK